MIEGKNNTREESNSSEFISWGMTNRNFQEFLENIPLTNKKTAWSKVCRNYKNNFKSTS